MCLPPAGRWAQPARVCPHLLMCLGKYYHHPSTWGQARGPRDTCLGSRHAALPGRSHQTLCPLLVSRPTRSSPPPHSDRPLTALTWVSALGPFSPFFRLQPRLFFEAVNIIRAHLEPSLCPFACRLTSSSSGPSFAAVLFPFPRRAQSQPHYIFSPQKSPLSPRGSCICCLLHLGCRGTDPAPSESL